MGRAHNAYLLLRLGESQPGDVNGQLAAALAYIKQLEAGPVAAGAPAEPSKLHRATPLQVPGNIFITYVALNHVWVR